MTGYFVISGGPGTGKSTLINALREASVGCFDEVSRELIIESNRNGTDLLPWRNLEAFAAECHRRMVELLEQVEPHELCFFDRGIPDIIAYLRNGSKPIPSELFTDGRRYTKLVFIAPPWSDIFINDNERPQTFNECLRLHNLILETYVELGYRVVMLPRVSVAERVWFVLKTAEEYLLGNNLEVNIESNPVTIVESGARD